MTSTHQRAVSSAKTFGGRPSDYIAVHEYIDLADELNDPEDCRNRAFLHSLLGVRIVCDVFGYHIPNSNGDRVSTIALAEQHIREELGFIPTLRDWSLEIQKKPWMDGAQLPPQTKEFDSAEVTSLITDLRAEIAQSLALFKELSDQLRDMKQQTKDPLPAYSTDSNYTAIYDD